MKALTRNAFMILVRSRFQSMQLNNTDVINKLSKYHRMMELMLEI